MNVTQIRTGNYVDFETIPYVVDSVTADGRLVVTALHHEWEPEPAGINEIEGIPIDSAWLEKNGFKPEGIFENLLVKELGRKRQLRYNIKTCRLYFETNKFLEGTPWPVKFVHQYQNAITDMEWEVEVKV